jgi:saccharopine dehydrogenase (NAD+, L-lysine forming)
MSENVLIVGGTGQVGRVVAGRLAERWPGRVLVAGRSLERAAAVAAEHGGASRPVQFDIGRLGDQIDALDGVRLAIVCVEQANLAFARAALGRGIHVIDISATYQLLHAIEGLDGLARQHNAIGLLSVGLAPGLTNLLARYGADLLESTESIDLFLMLGLGEAHGADAIRWTLETLSTSFSLDTPAGPRRVESFGEGRAVRFPGDRRPRRAYRFDFSDQHVLRRTLGVPEVSTWLCFDSDLATRAVALLKRMGAFRKADRLDPQLLARLAGHLPGGSDQFRVLAEVRGRARGARRVVSLSAAGYNEARATGMMTAYAAEHILGSPHPGGVYHSDQLLNPSAVLRALRQSGIRFQLEAGR